MHISRKKKNKLTSNVGYLHPQYIRKPQHWSVVCTYSECSVAKRKKCPTSKVPSYLERPICFFFFNYKLWGASVASKIRTQSFAVNEREVNLLVPNCHLGLTIDEWPGNRPLVYGWTGGGPRLQGKFAHHFRRIYVIYLKFV